MVNFADLSLEPALLAKFLSLNWPDMDFIHTLYTFVAAFLLLCNIYVIYQRFFHPLSRFPGPLVASLTNVWKSYYTYRLDLHEQLAKLHDRYGPVIRVGPNDLHFRTPDAIAPIYKSGRKMPKSPFYDAFTTFNPNLFGTQDEDVRVERTSDNLPS